MGHVHIRDTIDIQAPIERVFEHLVDHEAMSDWPGVAYCRLVREGTPRNGLGAIREMRARGLRLVEEVVYYEPPFRYDYTIRKGLPVDHLGSVTLAPKDGGVRLTWEIRMGSRWPLLCGVVGFLLAKGLPSALAHFKGKTEKGVTPA